MSSFAVRALKVRGENGVFNFMEIEFSAVGKLVPGMDFSPSGQTERDERQRRYLYINRTNFDYIGKFWLYYGLQLSIYLLLSSSSE